MQQLLTSRVVITKKGSITAHQDQCLLSTNVNELEAELAAFHEFITDIKSCVCETIYSKI